MKSPEVAALMNAATMLTPYATEFRYPGDWFEPLPEDADLALIEAQNICLLIREVLN